MSDSPLAPSINLLPPEILVDIFHFVCRTYSDRNTLRCWYPLSQPCWSEHIVLSHVCTHWRRIAINLGPLWSHIDLCAGVPLARLETCIVRSGQSFLDVHINTAWRSGESFLDDVVLPFLAFNAHRMRTLTLDDHRTCIYTEEDRYGSILATCFEKCIPGVLTQVSIDAPAPEDYGPDVVRERIKEGSLTQSAIDDFWLPVTFLRTTGYHLNWDSKAYHGLIELRLRSGAPSSAELMSVLQSSPQLRVLELDLDEISSIGSFPSPVHLHSLETLVITNTLNDAIGPILQLIAPSSRPLSLSIPSPYYQDSSGATKVELKRFFARSNVTRLVVHGFNNFFEVTEVLGLTSTIRDLALSNFKYDGAREQTLPPSSFTLDSLSVVRSCQSVWPDIESLVKRYNVQKLTLWACKGKLEGGDSKVEVPDNLYAICPVVKVIPKSHPNPILEWYPWN